MSSSCILYPILSTFTFFVFFFPLALPLPSTSSLPLLLLPFPPSSPPPHPPGRPSSLWRVSRLSPILHSNIIPGVTPPNPCISSQHHQALDQVSESIYCLKPMIIIISCYYQCSWSSSHSSCWGCFAQREP